MTQPAAMVPSAEGGNLLAVAGTTDVDVARAQQEARAEIESACVLARRFPREPMEVYRRILDHCKRSGFAKKAMYSYPRGNKPIEGPSINLARTMCQEWGNIRWGFDIVTDTPVARKIRAWAWDMERNTRVQAEDEFEKRIYRKGKGWIALTFENADDERSLRELTFRKVSLSLRGCLLQLIPTDFVEDAIKQVNTTLSGGDEKTMGERIKGMVREFGKMNITPEMIERKIRHKIEATTPVEYASLQNVYNSIKDGHATTDECFEMPETVPTNLDDVAAPRNGAGPAFGGQVPQAPTVDAQTIPATPEEEWAPPEQAQDAEEAPAAAEEQQEPQDEPEKPDGWEDLGDKPSEEQPPASEVPYEDLPNPW